MNTRQAAKYLGISYYYLRNLRKFMHNHEGPIYTMVPFAAGGAACHYAQSDLDAWAKAHTWRTKGEKRLDVRRAPKRSKEMELE